MSRTWMKRLAVVWMAIVCIPLQGGGQRAAAAVVGPDTGPVFHGNPTKIAGIRAGHTSGASKGSRHRLHAHDIPGSNCDGSATTDDGGISWIDDDTSPYDAVINDTITYSGSAENSGTADRFMLVHLEIFDTGVKYKFGWYNTNGGLAHTNWAGIAWNPADGHWYEDSSDGVGNYQHLLTYQPGTNAWLGIYLDCTNNFQYYIGSDSGHLTLGYGGSTGGSSVGGYSSASLTKATTQGSTKVQVLFAHRYSGMPGSIDFSTSGTSDPNGQSPSKYRTTCTATTHPVNCATGDFWHTFNDLAIPGRGLPIDLNQTYNSLLASQDSPLGFGWSDSYNMYLSADGGGNIMVHEEQGSALSFNVSGSAYQPASYVLATLVKNGDGTFTFTRLHGQQHYTFTAPSNGGQLLSETDRNGYTTSLAYTNGQLTSVTDPAGRALTFQYNASNRISSVTDPANRSVSFTYDSNGNLTDILDVGGGHWHFTYDTNHLLLTMEDPRQYAANGALSTGPVVTNVYDSQGRVTQQTDPMGRITNFSYVANQDGTQTTTITDPNGNVEVQTYQNNELITLVKGSGTSQATTTRYTYDPSTRGITSMTDPNSHVWTATYDSNGNRLTSMDPLNHTTTYVYNALNEPTSITDPNNVTTTLTYDSNGNLLTTSRPLTSTGQTATMSNTYGDPAHPGDITGVTDANNHTTSIQWDSNGDVSKVTDAAGDITTYSYDTIGRLTSTVSPKGNVTGGTPSQYTTTIVPNAYGDPTTVTDPLGHQTIYGYDADRNTTSVKDGRLNTTTNSYDNDNELTGVSRPDGSALGRSYDGDGNLTAQSNGLNETTSYAYNALDRLISKTDPLNRATTYAYDSNGNLTSLVDALNRTTTYGYNAANELTSISYSDGTTPNVSYTYDADGQRLTMGDGTGTNSYTYDSLNRLTQSTNGAGKSVGYGYDLAGNLTTLTYPDNTAVTRLYDAVNRLTRVTDWLTHATSLAYDANSNLTTQTYPNGTTSAFTYDRADNVTQILDKSGNKTLWNFGYTRDADNQVATASDPVSGVQHTYTNDTLNRLTGDTGSATTWSYDAADELTSAHISFASTTGWSYDAAGELTQYTKCSGSPCLINQQLTFTYNNNGDRLTQNPTFYGGSTLTYGYDQADRLRSWTNGTTTASYAYDGDGLRQSKTVGNTAEPFVWDLAEGIPLTIQDGSTKYVTGLGGLPLEQVNGTTVLYYYQDPLGSTRALLDGSGKTQATYVYDPYGNVTSKTGTVTNPFQFAGQYTDSESGLQYLRARYYEPATAQFLTVDPIVGLTQQPYSYASDNPVNVLDPLGTSDWAWKVPSPTDVANAIGRGLGDVGNGLKAVGNTVGAAISGPQLPPEAWPTFVQGPTFTPTPAICFGTSTPVPTGPAFPGRAFPPTPPLGPNPSHVPAFVQGPTFTPTPTAVPTPNPAQQAYYERCHYAEGYREGPYDPSEKPAPPLALTGPAAYAGIGWLADQGFAYGCP